MSENSIIERPKTRIVSGENERRAVELICEVRDLFEQWTREVPKKRKPWPESIKERILDLWRLGVSNHQISQESGVPVQTLYSWRQRIKKSGFSELPIRRSPRRTAFQIKTDEDRHSSALQLSQLESSPMTLASTTTVVVAVGNGLRIEGVPLQHVARVIKELSQS